jgi:hypothetical protein
MQNAALGACVTTEWIQTELQRFNQMPDGLLKKSELQDFFATYEKSYQTCPGNRGKYTASFGSGGYDTTKAELTSRWYNRYGSDVGPLESSFVNDTFPDSTLLEEFQLPPEGLRVVESRKLAIQQKNRQAKEGIASLPSSSCTKKDLRPKLGPMRLQGSTGMCASFATADLLSLETGKPVSPMSLMIGLAKSDRAWDGKSMVGDDPDDQQVIQNSDRGAVLWEPLMVAKDTGFCLESELASNWDDIIQKTDSTEVLKALRELEDPAKGQPASPGSCNLYTNNLRRLLPSASAEDLDAIYKASRGKLISSQFQKCQQKLSVESLRKYKHVEFAMGADQDLKKKILDQALDNGGMVVSEISPSLLAKAASASKKPRHAIGIVGRRTNPQTGACEYMIRNSMYDEAIDPSYTRESEGHTWVPETVILQSLRQMVYKKP